MAFLFFGGGYNFILARFIAPNVCRTGEVPRYLFNCLTEALTEALRRDRADMTGNFYLINCAALGAAFKPPTLRLLGAVNLNLP